MSSPIGSRGESVATAIRSGLRTTMKEALVEALEEVEAERARRSRGRRLVAGLALLGAGTFLGYRLRQDRLPTEAAETVAKRAEEASEQATETEQSGRDGGTARRLAMAGIVAGVGYALRRWYRSRDRRPTISERSEAAADRTESAADRAADRIEAGGERAADRVEEAGEAAEDVREETKEAIEERSEDTE